jgi:hypothetical protein
MWKVFCFSMAWVIGSITGLLGILQAAGGFPQMVDWGWAVGMFGICMMTIFIIGTFSLLAMTHSRTIYK